MSAAAARVMQRADALAACSERPGEITRRYGTPALVAARDLLEEWMRAAGMTTRVDRVGNLIGTLAGEPPRPAIVIGSHFDTVIDAGRYDGTLGILLGIACAEELGGAERAHDLTVVAFCDEEGVRFPTAYFGSRAFLAVGPEPDPALTDAEGATLASGLALAGNAQAPAASGLPPGAAAYIEAHIEQGPVLGAAGIRSGSSPRSRAARSSRSRSQVRPGTPARCRCACATTRSRPPPRSPWRPSAWRRPTARPWRRSARWP